jgi:hypothetical protein
VDDANTAKDMSRRSRRRSWPFRGVYSLAYGLPETKKKQMDLRAMELRVSLDLRTSIPTLAFLVYKKKF